jgi:hypothetical protein
MTKKQSSVSKAPKFTKEQIAYIFEESLKELKYIKEVMNQRKESGVSS